MRYPDGVECVAVNALKPNPRNARTHSQSQIKQIAASIKEYGFNNPVLADGDDAIIAGHGRVEAANYLGMEEVPVLRIEHLTEAQKRAYVIADNQLALKAGWDESILAGEFQYLTEFGFDTSLTGFDMGEIDQIISNFERNASKGDDVVPPVSDGPPITRPGDIWLLGPHRLICGNARDPETHDRLLDGEKAGLVLTDPPYNTKVNGHVSGLGRHKHREFMEASGGLSAQEFQGFLSESFEQLARVSRDGALHYIFMDWRHMSEVLAAGRQVYSELKNLCVWVKSNGGMGSLYRSRHELVFVYKAGTAKHTNNVQLGKNGRNRTNVWEYAGANSFGETRDDDLAMHPTVKPLEMVKDAILDSSDRGDIVLDGFAGSGTTLLAAHQAGRRGYAIELDPTYCDVIARRCLQAGLDPVLVETGHRFEDLAAEIEEVSDA